MWELDHKESWAPKKWCFWAVVMQKTLESPLDCKDIKPVNPKGNQSWIFIGRTDTEAETPILWPSDAKSWLIGKDPDAGKDWRREKGTREDKMVGWHHWLNGHESEQAPGDGEGQEAWCAAVHEVAETQTWLSNWTTVLSWIQLSPPRKHAQDLTLSTRKYDLIWRQGILCKTQDIDKNTE